ncbi:hypothetical protein RJ639_037811 [Escallonia herrerae]|uniref:Secreted protein n=1 Tax=Escallonia herrerae TaxID=1293975 RepID=A0AA89B3Q2_9ASTE|nr:hypothetical protein RJ639_037811 [Escallonia herrerae]
MNLHTMMWLRLKVALLTGLLVAVSNANDGRVTGEANDGTGDSSGGNFDDPIVLQQSSPSEPRQLST